MYSKKKVQPSELVEPPRENPRTFGRVDGVNEVGFKPKERRSTDVVFLFIFVADVLVLGILLGYCIINGDILRIVRGYDSCGNICGLDQKPVVNDEECANINVEDKPYRITVPANNTLIFIHKCVSNCSEYNYRPVFNRCLPRFGTVAQKQIDSGIRTFFTKISEDLYNYYIELICLCHIAVFLSILIIILYRYIIGYIVWGFLIATALVATASTTFFWIKWHLYNSDDNKKANTFLAIAILATLATVAILFIILVLRKRIQLMVQLFKEAGYAMGAIPFLIFVPVLSYACLALVLFLCVYFALWIESSGFLTQTSPHVYHYNPDFLMKFTRFYNIFIMLWLAQIITGCQYFIIAGAVSEWFFAKNKNSLKSPIFLNLMFLFRYHLGSIILGALIITIVKVIRALINYVQESLKGKENAIAKGILLCCQCCMWCFEKFLIFLNQNAYIEIAIHSISFCAAAKKAFMLLIENILRVAVINSIGEFLLFLTKLLVVALSVFIGFIILHKKDSVEYLWVALIIIGFFSYIIANCFISVYETVIDTIFICFCEDCAANDGISRPYYMSRGLMEFVENSKRSLEQQKVPLN